MQIEIGVIGALAGFLISYFGFIRNRDKDVKKDATESAVMTTKLDHISSGVDSIRVDMKVSERRVEEIKERVTRVEESSKQAHLRINQLSERGPLQ